MTLSFNSSGGLEAWPQSDGLDSLFQEWKRSDRSQRAPDRSDPGRAAETQHKRWLLDLHTRWAWDSHLRDRRIDPHEAVVFSLLLSTPCHLDGTWSLCVLSLVEFREVCSRQGRPVLTSTRPKQGTLTHTSVNIPCVSAYVSWEKVHHIFPAGKHFYLASSCLSWKPMMLDVLT